MIQAAEEKGVHAFGYHSDMSKYGPHTRLTATTHHWGEFYTQVVKDVMAGTWKPTNVWRGIKDGMIKLAPLNPIVPEEVADLVAQRQDEIVAGKRHPFQGPVKDQDGKVRVPDGQSMPDDQLAVMDFYVEGVQGKLPK